MLQRDTAAIEDIPSSEEPVELSKAEPVPEAQPEVTEEAPAEAQPETPEQPRVSLCPTDARGDQSAIDTGALVLWRDAPYLLAAHEHMGWSWLDEVAPGTIIEVTCGDSAGTYEAVGNDYVDEQGGSMPGYFTEYDLVLQTCSGDGSGFTLARRL
jgi:hypothetical protein